MSIGKKSGRKRKMPDKKRGIQLKLKVVIGIVSAVYFISMIVLFVNLMNSVQGKAAGVVPESAAFVFESVGNGISGSG